MATWSSPSLRGRQREDMALSIHWTAASLVVRWSLAQDTGVSQRLFFRSGDGQTTVLLTPVALPSSVVSYTLASQALSVPCGSV